MSFYERAHDRSFDQIEVAVVTFQYIDNGGFPPNTALELMLLRLKAQCPMN